MAYCTDGTVFNGRLEAGQVWVKGRTERTIHFFNEYYMYYLSKKDIREGTVTKVPRSTFRRWLYSGAKLKVEPRFVTCSQCKNQLELKEHVNKCECGNRIKILE